MSQTTDEDHTTKAAAPGAGAAVSTARPDPAYAEAKRAQDKRRRDASQIVFFSYPKFLYAWPLILLAAVFPLLGGLVSPGVEGWIFLITVLTVLMAMGFDLSRNLAISWLVTIVAIAFCIMWLKDARNVIFFSEIGNHLASKSPVISRDWQYLFALFGGLLYLIMILNARINQRWRITHNEIEHYSMLSKDDALGRGAKRVITSYPDFLELLLCGAGTIQIYSAQGGMLLRNISNVPWLIFRSAKISRILEATEVTASKGDEEEGQDGGHGGNEELGDSREG